MQARIQFNPELVEKLEPLQTEARMTGNLVLFRRTSAVKMATMRIPHDEIAQSLGICREVVGRWIAKFLAYGPSGLRSKKSSGRPPRLTPQQREELKQLIQGGPISCGYPGGVWTSAMIQEFIQARFHVLYSTKYIPQLMKELGLRYIKPKYTFSLTKEEFKAQLLWIRRDFLQLYEKVKQNNGVLLFQDESTCQLQPNVSHTWALKGTPPCEEKNPRRGNLKILGAIEFLTGKLWYSIQDKRLTNREFAQFLGQLLKHYAGKEVYVVLDGAKYHSGPALRKFLEKNPNLHLVKQPTKSPNLNPIEKLWKELKKDRTHNVFFKDKNALRRALRKGLGRFQESPEKVRSLMQKWEKVVHDPEKARRGTYDTSLVPKKYLQELPQIKKEVSLELQKHTQIQ